MSQKEEPSAEYRELEAAIHKMVASDEYRTDGLLVGWTLITVEHDMNSSSEAQGIIYPPHQSRTMTRGMVEWSRDMLKHHSLRHHLGDDEDDD